MFTKKAIGSTVTILVIATLLFLGCDQAVDNPTSANEVQPSALSKPSPVTIILENDGSFIATGALSASGTYVMDVNPRGLGPWGTTLHCPTVLTNANGTITVRLDCRMILTSESTAGGPGNWRILSGTGAYANLHGEGTLTMDIDFVANTAVENLVGNVFFDNRK